MAKTQSYLSTKLRKDLKRYIAAAGESYPRYLEWCESMQIPEERRFTKYYFKTWCQRHRDEINMYRSLRDNELRQISIYDKEMRIREIEGDIERINGILKSETLSGSYTMHECSVCDVVHDALPPDIVLKLIEQKRKLLESLSKERNEWMKSDGSIESKSSPVDVARSAALSLLQRPKETEIIDGEVSVGLD